MHHHRFYGRVGIVSIEIVQDRTVPVFKTSDGMTFYLSFLFCMGLVSTARGYLDIYPPVDENDPRTPLYFALLQSFGGIYNGSGSVAGLQVALDRINNEPSLLSGYSLHYTLTDSQVGQRGGRICIQQKLYSAVINNIFYLG